MAGGGFPEGGREFPAEGELGLRAAGVEGAAGGDVERGGGVPLELGGAVGPLWVGERHRGQEGLGVGVERGGAEGLPGGQVHQAPQVHDGDTAGDLGDDAQVVGNEEVGKAVALLQLAQ